MALGTKGFHLPPAPPKSPYTKVVNTVPVPAVLAGMYRTGMYTSIETSTFHTGLNTSRTGHIGHFRAIPGVLVGTEKSFFFFLSFVIFEFLLGQNDNLFALTY